MRRDKRANVLATLVFTAIVASTQVAEELGDRRWRELLARHHRIVRAALREYVGRELDTAGDGVFSRVRREIVKGSISVDPASYF